MKHPPLGRTLRRRLTVPPLSGGVELSSPPHLIGDDRLSDAYNLWWQHGTLRTRPALRDRGLLVGYADVQTATPLDRRTLLYGRTAETHRFVLADEDGSLHGTTHTVAGVSTLLAVPSGRDIADDDRLEAFLFLDGNPRRVMALSDEGDLYPQTPYVPTVLAAARPTAEQVREESGAATEPFNLLTDEFCCRYTSDGTGLYYWLPEGVTLDHTCPVTVYHTDAVGTTFAHTLDYRADDGLWKEATDVSQMPPDELALYYDPYRRCFWFVHAHGGGAAPVARAAVSGNVCLSATRTNTDATALLFGMRFGTWYDVDGGARLFLSGNPRTPNLVRWSALGNALYFPENNYAYVGDAGSAVTAFGKQSDLLVIFKERETYAVSHSGSVSYTADELLSGAISDTEVAAAVFAIHRVHPARGCDCPDTLCLCGDRLVWASSDGHVYALQSGGTYDARHVRLMSSPIEAQLRRYHAPTLAAATAACVDHHYVLYVGGLAFVLDTRSRGFVSNAAYSTEERAADAVAWQVWGVTPSPAAVRRLITVRGTPFVLSSLNDTLMTHAFAPDAVCDSLPKQGGNVLRFADAPIACDLTTKQYPPNGATYRQLCGVTLWISGAEGGEVTVNVCDGTTVRTATRLRLTGSLPEATLPRYLPLDLPRVHLCGIQLCSTGQIAVDGIEMTFRDRGEIRV